MTGVVQAVDRRASSRWGDLTTDKSVDHDGLQVYTVTSIVTGADRRDHVLARWCVNRSEHRVEPGLYATGHPTSGWLVFATASDPLSSEALPSAPSGIDAYIPLPDTQGINVRCAAGKGTSVPMN